MEPPSKRFSHECICATGVTINILNLESILWRPTSGWVWWTCREPGSHFLVIPSNTCLTTGSSTGLSERKNANCTMSSIVLKRVKFRCGKHEEEWQEWGNGNMSISLKQHSCACGDSVVISVDEEIRVVPVWRSTLAQVLLWLTFPSADRV